MKHRSLLCAAVLLASCSGESAPGAETDALSAGSTAMRAAPPACGLRPEQEGAFVAIPEGRFMQGEQGVYPEEGPAREVRVAAFSLQAHEVTNRQFEAFVAATGYVTDAERTSASGDPAGGSGLFTLPPSGGGMGSWALVRGATWKTPEGPGSGLAGRMDQPVVHVSLNDARAYARWAGGRLPSEAEWEYAASLGLPDPDVPVSGAYDAAGKPLANTWQGIFPVRNEGDDGFTGAAPVGCFPPSRIGLYDMIGNVWEWTETPFGPGQHTIKGGSYLCAENFCKRYRSAARQGQDIDFSSNHIGLRIVRDLPAG